MSDLEISYNDAFSGNELQFMTPFGIDPDQSVKDLQNRRDHNRDLEQKRKEISDRIFFSLRQAIALDESIIPKDLVLAKKLNDNNLIDKNSGLLRKVQVNGVNMISQHALANILGVGRKRIMHFSGIKKNIGQTFPTLFNIQSRMEFLILHASSRQQTQILLSAITAFSEFVELFELEVQVAYSIYELFNRYSTQIITPSKISNLAGLQKPGGDVKRLGGVLFKDAVMTKLINLFLLEPQNVKRYGIKATDLKLIKNEIYDLLLGGLIEKNKIEPEYGPEKFSIIFKTLLAINSERTNNKKITSLNDLSSSPFLSVTRKTFSATLTASGYMTPLLTDYLTFRLQSLKESSMQKYAKKSILEYKKSRKDSLASSSREWNPLVVFKHLYGFPKKMWRHYIYLYQIRKFMKSNAKVTILGKTFNSFKLVEQLWGKKGTYILDWGRNRVIRKVEILIKQAGMIPYYDIRNEVERATVLDRIFQHHIKFDKRSTDTIDLILLGDLHPVLNSLESLKPIEYTNLMHEFRTDFESLKPYRNWNSRLKAEYNSKIQRIVKDWRNNGEIRWLGITKKWLKNVTPRAFTVNLLDGRIVGESNYLTEQQLSNVVTKKFTISQFIDYVIAQIARKLGI